MPVHRHGLRKGQTMAEPSETLSERPGTTSSDATDRMSQKQGTATGAASAAKIPATAGPEGTVLREPVTGDDKIKLSIVHGHLAFARFPVLVGHYNGDTFAGAEAQLDKALALKLSERRHLGLYPGPIATSTVVLDSTARPRGAIVVGLGEPASLSVGTLQRTLRHGLLSFAASEVDRRRVALACQGSPDLHAATPLSISALMVGAGEGGLDRTSCVKALLQAVAEARMVLMKMNGSQVRIGSIEIIELLEYRALAIWRSVGQVLAGQPELRHTFELTDGVTRRSGARRRVTAGRDAGWWQPIQITMSGDERDQRNLSFSVASGLARAEARTIAADLDLIKPLMQRAISNVDAMGAASSPGRALFELLWPGPLKDQSMDERNRRLILDEHSACFPWELLDDRRPWATDSSLMNIVERQPPAVRAGLVRQLLQTRFREQVVMPHGRPKALVIGDPRGIPMEEFLKLPAAEREARLIAEQLAKTHDVTALIGDFITPEQVCSQLFAQSWEIVHISAHGVVDELLAGPDGVKRRMTGVILGGGIVLGPSTLSKLPVSPSLFFLNCCHLGRIDSAAEDKARETALASRPELAANVAVELIRNGVRCIIAAGWAVDDDAAEAFGIRLYTEMLGGASFGDATLRARQDAYQMRPDGNTWGAYQCYGEPDYRLRETEASVEDPDEAVEFASIVEAIEAAERIREDINIGLERNLHVQRKHLVRIEKEAEQRGWLNSAELRVAIAEARAELGDLLEAIDHYEKAVTSDDNQCKVKAAEQLANLRARYAAASFRCTSPGDVPDAKNAAEVIEAALHRVEALVQAFGATRERLSLQGSCWKRLAQVRAAGTGAEEALVNMARFYDRADGISQSHDKYPRLMSCSASICSALRNGTGADNKVLDFLKELKDAPPSDDSDFWQLIMSADARMMLAMTHGEITEREQQEIEDAYRCAWRYVGSPVKLMSVLEQLEFYQDILSNGSEGSRAKREKIAAWIVKIHGVLRSEFLG